MSKRFSHALAALALAFPVVALADTTLTLQSGQRLNLDTGATVSSGGDLLWDGTTLTPQGSATGVDLPGEAALYSTLTQSTTALFATGQLSAAAMTPAASDLIIVKTNGGNYSKIDVTSVSGTSLSIKFNTFGGSSTSGGPSITSLQNNYSYIQPGLPSYGIAPGSLFIIFGSGMSDNVAPVLQSSAAPGLPTTLNHTSLSVTVNGKTTTPGIYYTSPGQIAAVLPSSTPAGSGTITVDYNGASASASIQVVASAFGMDTLYGTGSGAIVATVGSSVIVPTASASPGQTITIWGSGLGADTANDDKTFPLKQDNLKNAQVYIGGVQATVTYDGRSQYPGVDQVDVVVPSIGAQPAFQTASLQGHAAPRASGFQGGCGVSVVVVANGRASNFGTIPINPGGGVCSDPSSGVTGSEIGSFGGQTNFKSGFVDLFQATEPQVGSSAKPKPEAQTFKTSYSAIADFQSVTGASYVTSGSFTSIGSCIVSTSTTSTGSTGQSKGLDAGSPIVLTGGGQNVNLTEESSSGIGGFGVGLYVAEITNPLLGGSAYTFTGPGGKDVGPFKATITFPVPLDWTNEGSISAVTESKGQLITWTGGATGTYVEISGSSTDATASVSAAFVCLAPASDQQFTVPSYVLLTLPTGTGSLGVYNFSTPVSFTASGIDYGYATAGVISDETVTYQ